jgi:hypothetical protein
MNSTFTWLDYSEGERRKMLDVIDLFREKETRDELGLSVVRDAFANMLFPGTSTIQTRARYFLFVPWIYLGLEWQKVGSAQMATEAREREVALTDAIVGSEDSDGVFGKRSRRNLKRLPSSVYWQGLSTWGIRLFPGSQAQYHRSLDGYYRATRRGERTDDGEPIDDGVGPNWHPNLPHEQSGFLKQSSFRVTKAEAEYLRERILAYVPNTLLAFLVDRGRPTQRVSFPWEHEQYEDFPSRVREQLNHARNFSETVHGAPLLYNLMLAEAKEDKELADWYGAWLSEWAESLKARRAELADWDRDEFWEMLASTGSRVAPTAWAFMDTWLDTALDSERAAGVAENEDARRLILDREVALKGSLARLRNQSALELWNEASGTYRINYRWGNAQTIVADILAGLEEGEDNA